MYAYKNQTSRDKSAEVYCCQATSSWYPPSTVLFSITRIAFMVCRKNGKSCSHRQSPSPCPFSRVGNNPREERWSYLSFPFVAHINALPAVYNVSDPIILSLYVVLRVQAQDRKFKSNPISPVNHFLINDMHALPPSDPRRCFSNSV